MQRFCIKMSLNNETFIINTTDHSWWAFLSNIGAFLFKGTMKLFSNILWTHLFCSMLFSAANLHDKWLICQFFNWRKIMYFSWKISTWIVWKTTWSLSSDNAQEHWILFLSCCCCSEHEFYLFNMKCDIVISCIWRSVCVCVTCLWRELFWK